MKRILLVVTVALVMAVMAVVMAVPAFAAKGGGEPPDSSCGIGQEGAHNAIEKPKKGPGASEAGHISTTVCSGQ